ncbi:hypothetical protein D9756_007015 [Leucocoprinus leucothites]|uniref:FAD-binding domain-containing protein n=1 Tax=Leucocoprinus leucothites TaxID=201217 RepID=A0A8H5D5I3_9AGAR|nr:hypothetical protein D9756_007015 [Leucoagaricus leucothites]
MTEIQGERLKIAIVGAGIAGLSLAVAINALDQDHKIAIDIYESTPELSEIGAGVNVWPRTWCIFEKIGLGESLAPLFDHPPNLEPRVIYEIRKADQKDGFRVMEISKNGGGLRIHRADLQRCLVDHLPLPSHSGTKANSSCTLYLSHRLVDYTYQPSSVLPAKKPVVLHFADKPSRTCDILVGADGIKSTVRQLFLTRLPNAPDYQKCLSPRWSATVAYRSLIEKEMLRRLSPNHRALDHPGIMYVGRYKHAVAYSISGGRYLNIVATIHDKSREGTAWEGPWNSEVSRHELLDQFRGWDEEFQQLLQCIERPTRWALHDMHPLDTFASQRVLLLGDAAHAMLPYQGAGAGAGIEDAYILATLLTHRLTSTSSSPDHLSKLIDIYNCIRVPSAAAMVKSTVTQGALYTLAVPELDEYKEGDHIPFDRLLDVFHTVADNWSWTSSDPEEDRRTAVELLQRSCGQARL